MSIGVAQIWYGCEISGWIRMLRRNRFAVDVSLWPVALLITLFALLNSSLKLTQGVFLGRRIKRVSLQDDPVFVIGHWRSGTTFMHNLLSCDRQFTWPTANQCFSPNHFALTSVANDSFLSWILPRKRIVDDMPLLSGGPQEDEFALVNMGLPSPYSVIAFPDGWDGIPASLDLEGLASAELEKWKTTFVHFLKQLTYVRPGRLLLKSPTHSCRIPVLMEMFPRARFIYLVRSPYSVIPSTINMWTRLFEAQGLQRARGDIIRRNVFAGYRHLINRVEETRSQVPAGQFSEVRFEDLIANPIGVAGDIYKELDLGRPEALKGVFEAHLAGIAGYSQRSWPLASDLEAEIDERCADMISRYGYGRGI